ncbi:MAG: hypothetical protein ACO3EZ_14160 [Prochlorotrichaceae cyanobacterium]
MSKAYSIHNRGRSQTITHPDPWAEGEEHKPLRELIQGLWQTSITFLVKTIPLAIGCSVLGAIVYFTAGDKVGLALGAGSFAMILSWQYPRGALWFFFLYMPFAGTVTYWLVNGNTLFQLAKDAFYIPALISLFLAISRTKKKKFFHPKVILPSLWLLVSFCFLSLLFVSIPRQFLEGGLLFAQGLLGLKVLIGYIPLIFLMQILIRGKRELWFLNRTHVLLAIVCCGLCFLQYFFLSTGRCQGTDHLQGAALFETTLDAKCLVGGSLLYSPSQGVIRLPGTFVAPWQWGWFLIGNAYLTFAGAFADPSWRWRTVSFGGMVSVTAAAVISGQRVALALVPASFLLLLVLTGQLLNVKRLVQVGLGAIVTGLFAWFQYRDLIISRIENFQGRWQASPADDMIAHQFGFVWKAMKGPELLLGHGLGSATNSARMFGNTWLIETWFPKLLFETGLLGVALFLIFVTVLSVAGFQYYRRLQDRSLKDLAACYWVFVLFISYQTYYYPLDVDPVAVYYWMMLGVLFRLPEIDRPQEADSVSPSEKKGGSQGKSRRFAPMRRPPQSKRNATEI